MLKLQVSESWMMSRRAVAMRRLRESVDKVGRRESLESGFARARDGVKGAFAASVAVGRRKVVNTVGMDFVRWKVGARWVVRKEGVAKSFCGWVRMVLE
jgi:hypothetical protein